MGGEGGEWTARRTSITVISNSIFIFTKESMIKYDKVRAQKQRT